MICKALTTNRFDIGQFERQYETEDTCGIPKDCLIQMISLYWVDLCDLQFDSMDLLSQFNMATTLENAV